jgi:SAM-dependent methyltransferase
MSNEASKALHRRQSNPLYHRAFRGHGLDIGCGNDPLRACDWPGIIRLDTFDKEDGNAENINNFLPYNNFDFIHASQCLEHMTDPADAFRNWLKVLKVGGYAVISVPDFDLYEQGFWPSRFNPDHKSTWSMEAAPNEVGVCVLNFVRQFNVRTHLIQLCDQGYDYSVKGRDQTYEHPGIAEAFIEFVVQKC